MSKKVDRAVHGPGWGEVILGAVLSLVLGVALGVVLLVLRPVTQVKELPKEADRDRNAVYYIEGSRETSKAKQALAKRKAFVEGQSVTATEEEINSLIASAAAPATAAPKPGEKAAPPPAPAASGETLSFGVPNVRIRDGVLQVGVPVTIGLLGLDQKIVAHARGDFEKEGDVFVYRPSELYLGSCPVQRLPFVSSYVRNKFLAAQSIPEDIATAWKKVSGVSIEGNAIKVTTQ